MKNLTIFFLAILFSGCATVVHNDKKHYVENEKNGIHISIHYLRNNDRGSAYLSPSDVSYYFEDSVSLKELFPPFGILIVSNISQSNVSIPDFHRNNWKLEISQDGADTPDYIPLMDVWNYARFLYDAKIVIAPSELVVIAFGAYGLIPASEMFDRLYLHDAGRYGVLRACLFLDDGSVITSNELIVVNKYERKETPVPPFEQ